MKLENTAIQHVALHWIIIGFCLVGGTALAGSGTEESPKPLYLDFYLTENRICKACTGFWTHDRQVALENRQGHRTVVDPEEIIGVDRHPLGRRLLRKSLHGIGLPAKVIVPYAFDDYKDFVCKYCDK